jgi:hypothetical protein
MDRLKQIQNTMPDDAEILVRTAGKTKWFIHYILHNENHLLKESLFREYVDDLDNALNKVLEIINR